MLNIFKKLIVLFLAFSTTVGAEEYFDNYKKDCESALQENYIEILKECIIKLPENEYQLEILKYKGFIFQKNSEYEKAEGFYLEFLEKNKKHNDNIIIHILLGNLFVGQSYFFKAIQNFSKANILNKKIKTNNNKINNAKIKLGINSIFYYLNINKEIVDEYQKTIELLETINTKEAKQLQVEALFIQSIIFSKIKDSELAIRSAERGLVISEENDYLLGLAYSKKALVFAYINEEPKVNIDKAEGLIAEAEEIFNILDIKDEVIFNIDILKTNILLYNKKYAKAKQKLDELEKLYLSQNSKNYLKSIYSLYYNLYNTIGNKEKSIFYKLKEININKELRKQQDTEIIFKFKNEFYLSEFEDKKKELKKITILNEKEIEKEEILQSKYLLFIYFILTFVFIFLIIILVFVIKRKKLILFKNELDENKLHYNKTFLARIHNEESRTSKEKLNKSNTFCLISYKIKNIKDIQKDFSSNQIEQFNLYLENEIKLSLRKGDMLLKKNNKLIIIAKSTSDESFYICLRIINNLSKNKYIKNNIYFGTTLLNNEGNNINSKIKEIEEKINREMKKSNNYIINL